MNKHNLHSEFPEFNEKIHELKISNKHFRTIFNAYEDLNHTIHGVESTGVYEDSELNTLKGLRVQLKDKLYKMLKDE